MIYVNFKIVEGEHEYHESDYYKMDLKDYEKGVITDKDIIAEFLGLEDEQFENFEDDSYWWGSALISVRRVQEITQDELEVVRRFC